jgi:hypothetical protein
MPHPDRNLILYLEFPYSWGIGKIHRWYLKRKDIAIKTLEVRKEVYGIQHEYILVELVDGSMFSIDRRPDPDVPIDTIMRDGATQSIQSKLYRQRLIFPPRLSSRPSRLPTPNSTLYSFYAYATQSKIAEKRDDIYTSDSTAISYLG